MPHVPVCSIECTHVVRRFFVGLLVEFFELFLFRDDVELVASWFIEAANASSD